MSDFTQALSVWKDIDLSELRKRLDTQGLEIVDNQKESVVGRKALADKTKEFKKLADEEKPEAIKGLLKAYQNEIDSLTKRCKASDSAFLGIYKLLAEAPDPYPLLNSVVDMMVKVSDAEERQAELKNLREENAELKRQVTELGDAKKKADTLEEKMESVIQTRVSQKEAELNATYDEKMRNYEDREQDLQRQLTLTRGQLKDLRASHDTSQAKLLDHSERQEQEVDAKLAEMELISGDLERANSRVAAVERRNEILRAEIESLRTGSDSVQRTQTLEAQLAESDAETQRLRVAFEELKRTTSETIVAAERKTAELEKEASARGSEIESLKSRLKQYADYDEIKRELGIMKFVEFGQDDDDEAPMPDPNADKANLQQGQSLEGLLMAKNRKLLEELTKIRVAHSELESSLQAISEEIIHTREELEKQTSLNEKLENDLLQINQRASNGAAEREEAAPSGQDGLSGLNLGRKSTNVERTATPQPDNSILPIVTSQRDRFRQRNAELEEELRKQFESISELRNEIKTLQSDNMKLYEKVRYMQSYRDEGSASWSSVTAQANSDLGKYRTMYEDSLNPFQAFRGQVNGSWTQDLNVIERTVLIITRQVLGNRRARTAFIAYAFFLHGLVLYITYECAGSSQKSYKYTTHEARALYMASALFTASKVGIKACMKLANVQMSTETDLHLEQLGDRGPDFELQSS
ncbi:CASP C terminal-domain-containing protein [Rhizoctonia solani]|nr:CASP C terminal-domain-containing protein [Rhizoctonia solani]